MFISGGGCKSPGESIPEFVSPARYARYVRMCSRRTSRIGARGVVSRYDQLLLPYFNLQRCSRTFKPGQPSNETYFFNPWRRRWLPRLLNPETSRRIDSATDCALSNTGGSVGVEVEVHKWHSLMVLESVRMWPVVSGTDNSIGLSGICVAPSFQRVSSPTQPSSPTRGAKTPSPPKKKKKLPAAIPLGHALSSLRQLILCHSYEQWCRCRLPRTLRSVCPSLGMVDPRFLSKAQKNRFAFFCSPFGQVATRIPQSTTHADRNHVAVYLWKA